MKRVLVLLALIAALFPASAMAKCHFACVAHKVTDLKTLTHGLQTQLEEDEGRIVRQAASIETLRTRASQLETWSAQMVTWAKTFEGCFGEVPVSRYGEEQGPSGYLFRLSGPDEDFALPTTALDMKIGRAHV